MEEEVYPKNYIRRFDIFAEYNRLQALNKYKYSEDDAKAYGIAIAKVVAGRKFRKLFKTSHLSKSTLSSSELENSQNNKWWRKFGSSKEFDKEIVDRMGRDFYEKVFSPAVQEAYKKGLKYIQIRDTLREEWNKKVKIKS